MERQQHQGNEAEDFKKFQEEQEENEGVLIHEPKTVFDGVCEHYFVDEGIDSDGHGNAGCKKCPMGRMYNPKEMELKDGRLITRG